MTSQRFSLSARSSLVFSITALVMAGCGQRAAEVSPPAAGEQSQQSQQPIKVVLCTLDSSTSPYCASGKSSCGSSSTGTPLCCYDSASLTCFVDGEGSPIICPKGDVPCGLNCVPRANLNSACKNAVTDGSCDKEFTSPGLCITPVGGLCYDTTTQRCEGLAVCDIATTCAGAGADAGSSGSADGGRRPADCFGNQVACGGLCYDPSGPDVCIQGTLCPKGHGFNGVCSGQCFNKNVNTCIDGILCGLADTSTCAGQCYSYFQQGCCFSTLYDATTQSCCGTQVYDGKFVNDCAQCLEEGTAKLGDACISDSQCKKGHCSSEFCGQGTCVCSSDADCGNAEFCWTGVLGIGKNECRPKKALSDTCSRGGQCTSNCCKLDLSTNPVSPVCRPTDKCN